MLLCATSCFCSSAGHMQQEVYIEREYFVVYQISDSLHGK